jgi:hypothetical protein
MAAGSRAVMPKVIDTAMHATGASTEKMPLMPHAQGT